MNLSVSVYFQLLILQREQKEQKYIYLDVCKKKSQFEDKYPERGTSLLLKTNSICLAIGLLTNYYR